MLVTLAAAAAAGGHGRSTGARRPLRRSPSGHAAAGRVRRADADRAGGRRVHRLRSRPDRRAGAARVAAGHLQPGRAISAVLRAERARHGAEVPLQVPARLQDRGASRTSFSRFWRIRAPKARSPQFQDQYNQQNKNVLDVAGPGALHRRADGRAVSRVATTAATAGATRSTSSTGTAGATSGSTSTPRPTKWIPIPTTTSASSAPRAR